MTINGVYILIIVGAWVAYKLGMRFGVDGAPDRENGSGREHRGAMCWCGRDHRFTSDPNREVGSPE